MPAKSISPQEINNIVWKACDTFRGAIDPAEYKNYILTMLFVKYMSDVWTDIKQQLLKEYKGDTGRLERALTRQRFVVPDGCDFNTLFEKRHAPDLGDIINKALEKIEDANKAKLERVFRNVDFNSDSALGEARERNRRLKSLLEDFNDERLDFMPSHLEADGRDILGDAYEYLIARFAAGAGKKAGEFYTPPEVSTLLAKLVAAEPGNTICDPACGSASLLIKVAKEIGSDDFHLAGQESNGSTWSLAKMNMFLHGMDSAQIEWCNTIHNPKLVVDGELRRYDIVVANPPFSLDKWGDEIAANDQYRRFERGIPPKSRGDYAFILHMITIAAEGQGRVGVIVPHGVLFRGGSEGAIRQKLIEENMLEAVIGLPAQLFFGTGIPAAILVFNKARKPWEKAKSRRDTHVLFIDASREFDDGKTQNRLRAQDIEKISRTYRTFEEIEKYSHLATREEIEEADYNLNIPRYVDTFEEEEPVDLKAVQKEIARIEKELADTQAQMQKYLKELGV